MNESLERKINSEIISQVTTEIVTIMKNMLSDSRADTDKIQAKLVVEVL